MNASLMQVALVLIASIAFTGCSSSKGSKSANNGFDNSAEHQTLSTGSFKAEPIDYSLISDAKLRDCIKESGAVDTSPQVIVCSGKGVYSLAGIEQFGDLRVLDVRANNLENIDELASLTRLSSLNISYNQIYSLGALANLKRLTKIVANNNNLHSLDELSELPNLKNLYVSNNSLTNLAALNDFDSLEYLTAENNHASIPNALPQSLKSFRL